MTAEAPVHPSEDAARVIVAVQNVLPQADVRFRAERSVVTAHGALPSLQGLYEGARSRRILGVMRRLLLQNASVGETWLLLHKQAAYGRVVALCEGEGESPLGPIRINLRCGQLPELVEWLAPHT